MDDHRTEVFNGQQRPPLEKKPNIAAGGEDDRKRHNYKLLTDPMLKTGPTKAYRFDGIAPQGEPNVQVRDPRSRFARFWRHKVQVDLPVPQYKYDEYYIGTPLPKEVTFTNLNDNISVKFLDDMCKGFGNVEDCKIYFHPQSRKHLGIGKVHFTSTKSAKLCVEKYHNQSKMGNIMNVFLDTMGKERQRLINNMTNDGRTAPEPERAVPPPTEHDSNPDPRDPLGLNDSRRNHSSGSFSEDQPHPQHQRRDSGYSVDTFEESCGDARDRQRDAGSNAVDRASHMDDRGGSRVESDRGFRGSAHTPHPPGASGDIPPHLMQQPPQQMYPPSHDLNAPQPPPGVDHAQGPPIPPSGPPLPPPGPFGMAQQHVDRMYHHQHGPPGHKHGNQHGAYHHHSGSGYQDRGRKSGGVDAGAGGYDHRQGRNYKDRYRDYRQRDNGEYSSSYSRPNAADEYGSAGFGGRSRQHSRERGRLSESRSHSRGDDDERNRRLRGGWEARGDESRRTDRENSWTGAVSDLQAADDLEHNGSSRRDNGFMDAEPRTPGKRDDRNRSPSPPPVAKTTASPSDQQQVNGSPEPERHMSLESRINALLGQAPADASESASKTAATDVAPQTDFAPNSRTASSSQHRSRRQDDEMSISSGDSGNDGFHAAYGDAPQDFDPPPPGLPAAMWNQNYLEEFRHSQQQDAPPQEMDEPSWSQQDDAKEDLFNGVLDRIISELKLIMKRDIDKRMLVKNAFNAFEDWWTWEEKVLSQEKPIEPTIKEEKPEIKVETPTVSATPTQEISSALNALFDKKDGLGMGGLLGLRGALPKMPSFRKIKRPKTPPPEDDDEALTSRRGPRTPPDSSDMSGSDTPTGSRDFPDVKRRKKKPIRKPKRPPSPTSRNIYSSDESDSGDSSDRSSSSSRSSSSGMSERSSSPIRAGNSEDDISTEAASKSESSDEDVVSAPTASKKPATPIASKSPGSDRLSVIREESGGDELMEDGELDDDDVTRQDDDDNDVTVDKDDDEDGTKNIKLKTKDVLKKVGEKTKAASVTSRLPSLSDVEIPAPPKRRRRGRPKKAELLEREAALSLVRPGPDHSYSAPHSDKPVKTADARQRAKTAKSGTDSASEGEADMVPTLPPEIQLDHNYCLAYFPLDNRHGMPQAPATADKKPVKTARLVDVEGIQRLKDVTNQMLRVTKPYARRVVKKPPPKYKQRNPQEDRYLLYDFLLKGVDSEDMNFLKRRYEDLLADDAAPGWLNDTHWVDHTRTLIPDPPGKKRRLRALKPSLSKAEAQSVNKKSVPNAESLDKGCARAQGYYKIPFKDKGAYLSDLRGITTFATRQVSSDKLEERSRKLKQDKTREAKSENRRILNVLGEDLSGDILKFNHLKFRRKQVKFCKSSIHNWGLFALETIPAEEMVIEYVGQMIRSSVADKREKRYESQGIGSSYLFRVDAEFVIDATKCGSLGRFINHSCNPNCTAKVITVDNTKKIVIYSKREIAQNEEVTYDYKFPLEDEKIPCFCGASHCRGTLN